MKKTYSAPEVQVLHVSMENNILSDQIKPAQENDYGEL